ncbi:unnamed protein product [Vitrella brassicaformis CCMP3155]|uniref:Uncharacterized protein n=1 Tax=Vitrella brassicaformis (strain CCMP3155) TaxID=1169540 RepID=A0A0G4ENL5_VITBC|nr:unnamed protein product [Vitrella brassicaformis CCMP3155]|eukprot:CEL99193.1 unnamed protein product [Vitrella brassicaformis CCMP3155]
MFCRGCLRIVSTTATTRGSLPVQCPKLSSRTESRKWDGIFITLMDRQTLLDMMEAADYLNITSLLQLTATRVACDWLGDPLEFSKAFATPKQRRDKSIGSLCLGMGGVEKTCTQMLLRGRPPLPKGLVTSYCPPLDPPQQPHPHPDTSTSSPALSGALSPMTRKTMAVELSGFREGASDGHVAVAGPLIAGAKSLHTQPSIRGAMDEVCREDQAEEEYGVSRGGCLPSIRRCFLSFPWCRGTGSRAEQSDSEDGRALDRPDIGKVRSGVCSSGILAVSAMKDNSGLFKKDAKFFKERVHLLGHVLFLLPVDLTLSLPTPLLYEVFPQLRLMRRMRRTRMQADMHEALGLKPDASLALVRRRFKHLSIVCHPTRAALRSGSNEAEQTEWRGYEERLDWKIDLRCSAIIHQTIKTPPADIALGPGRFAPWLPLEVEEAVDVAGLEETLEDLLAQGEAEGEARQLDEAIARAQEVAAAYVEQDDHLEATAMGTTPQDDSATTERP